MRHTSPFRPVAPAVALLAVLAGAGPGAAGAQVLGLPVVQSPFPGRPFAVALNGGTASGGVRVAGLAVAAHRPAGRLVASLGVGRARGFEAARTTYGGRLAYALRLGESRVIGVAPFVGYGRVQGGDTVDVREAGDPRLGGAITVVPLGAGMGYRRQVAGRAVVVHVTPQAQWWRRGPSGAVPSASAWYGRAAVGADVAVTPQIGLSVAYEDGGSTSDRTAGDRTAGPRSGAFGVGLSYAPGRRPPR